MAKQKSKVKDKEKKKNTSLRLDAKTLKELKLIALRNDTSIQRIIEELIVAYIRNNREKNYD